MAQFATNAELAARLGLTFSAAEQARADALLTSASGLIQEHTGQTILLVSNDSFTRPGSYSDRIGLPQRPVVSVASVTVDGTALTAGSDFYIDGDELVRMGTASPWHGLPAPGWGNPWQSIVVVYTHGYATIPARIKAICQEMVVRVWVNPGSVIQESVGDVQTTYAPYVQPPRGLLLTDAEKDELNDIFRRVLASPKLR